MEESILDERKVKIDEWTVNYVIVGRGGHVVLLMPGIIGTLMLNFKSQVSGLNRDQLTIIAWDPPGHGRSYPLNRWFHEKFYEEYADLTYQFMKALPFSKYSLLGWCGGARASMILAAKHPDMVTALVLWNTSTYFKPNDIEIMARFRDPLQWPEIIKLPFIEIYGEQYLQDYWERFITVIEKLGHEHGGEICSPCLEQIKCPTLLIQGTKDYLDASHIYFMHERIKGSMLYRFEEGRHGIHRTHAKQFNALVEEYLAKIDMED